MFTGIVEELGTVAAVEDSARGDGEPDRVALVLDGGDGAELLDDAGEHVSTLPGGSS